MKKLAVAVLTREAKYGKDLARGIAEESEKISVRCEDVSCLNDSEKQATAEKLTEAGYILVTDELALLKESLKEQSLFLVSDEKDITETANSVAKLSATETIFQKIREMYFSINQIDFFRLQDGEEKLIGIFSGTGGAGTTTVSIATARWLSMISDEPVLYINVSLRDDYKYYAAANEKRFSKKKLLFHIAEGMNWQAEDYCYKDKYGVSYFMPETGDNCFSRREYLEKLLTSLAEKKVFKYIVMDGLCCGMENLCDLKISILKADDSRSSFHCEDKDFITAYNWSEKERGLEAEDNCIYVRKDPESFKADDTGIQLSIEGSFSASARHIAEKVLKEN